jgi:Tol biopolymer transport system component/DNA-binding winged helix-turn-helix (wHTH) protein
MEESLSSPRIVRFGAYEVDLRSGELRKNGLKTKLQEQPFQVLAMLLQRPGEVVTREELQKAVWPADTFVDFDRGLNKAINKIREALGDSADSPRYVETLPRRGYRFVAPVERSSLQIESASPDKKPAPQSAPSVRQERSNRDLDSGRTREAWPTAESGFSPTTVLAHQAAYEGRQHRRWWGIAKTVAGAIIVIGAVTYLSTRPLPLPTVIGYTQLTHDGRQKTQWADSPLWPAAFPLVSDGSRLYFWEMRQFDPFWAPGRVTQISTTGGETVALSIALPYPLIGDISPNGAELVLSNSPNGAELLRANCESKELVLSNGDSLAPWTLWAVPLPGGTPHRLTEAGQDATWSPDGLRIVYTNGSRLYVVRSDGSELRKIATVSGYALRPRISPDGRRIRLSVFDAITSSVSLWEVGIDGSHLHRLLPGWANPPAECCGSWTPDGKYFVFQAKRNGKQDIWALRDVGHLFRKPEREPIKLTTGPLNYWSPLPSKDGRKLFVIGEQLRGELVRYDAKLRQLGRFLDGISADQARFSRDGQWAAYIAYPEGTLWRSKMDGSQRLQLTFSPMLAAAPRWSPDGKRITFVGGSAPEKLCSIYMVSSDGGKPEKLMPHEPCQGANDWSPDGNSLIFVQSGGVSINVLDLKTRRVSVLPGSKGLGDTYEFCISPDGRYLVAMPPAYPNHSLIVLDMRSHKTVEMACPPESWPQGWSRDSKYVYLDWVRGGIAYVSRLRISDNKLEPIANFGQLQLAAGTSGFWMGLAPDESWMMLRNAAIQEIYALDWEAP